MAMKSRVGCSWPAHLHPPRPAQAAGSALSPCWGAVEALLRACSGMATALPSRVQSAAADAQGSMACAWPQRLGSLRAALPPAAPVQDGSGAEAGQEEHPGLCGDLPLCDGPCTQGRAAPQHTTGASALGLLPRWSACMPCSLAHRWGRRTHIAAVSREQCWAPVT